METAVDVTTLHGIHSMMGATLDVRRLVDGKAVANQFVQDGAPLGG